MRQARIWVATVITAALVAPIIAMSALAASNPGKARAIAEQSSPIRFVVPLTTGWRFQQNSKLTGAEDPAFDDADWQVVEVPHTWNRVGHYIPDPASHINRVEDTNKVQGVGWYRLNFTPDPQFRGKRAWLEFDAASRVAEVWLNGTRLGEHAGGFSRFRFDATDVLRINAANNLVVKVDNSMSAGGRVTLPLAGDFFIHGGLYRPVRLIATDDVHVEMLDHGSTGIYASTRSIENGSATIAVRALLRNDGEIAAQATAVVKLVDAVGQTAAERLTRISLPAGQTTSVEHDLVVPNAHLWQGVVDPYLYRLVVEVHSANGAPLDRVAQAFGIRRMRIDPKNGFFLNDKPYQLRGTGIHQDIEGKGWALSEADIAADIAMLRELGATSLRLSHYQYGPRIHELADQAGLILWDEIPLVTLFNNSPAFIENARQQLRELIRQNYNYASVAVWGIANEVDFGASMPGFLGSVGDASPLPLLRELNALAKAEDPTRPTTQANCCEGRLFAGNVDIPIVASATDLSGVNRYFGWYYGVPSDLGPHLDATRAKRPDQPLSVSEYGGGGAVTIHTDDPKGGLPDSRGRRQPEEYMSYIHEEAWPTLATKPYLWGIWLWNSVDFATTVRREGDANDINTKGLVTYDRKIKKDAFYYYKANWNNDPTVHIAGRRYVDRAYRINDLKVYSNARETSLTLNGRPLGSKSDCPYKVCVWEAVKLDIGENVIMATGYFTNGKYQDRILLQAAPRTGSEVRIDSGALVAGNSGAVRFGSDTFFVGGNSGTVAQVAQYGKPEVARTITGAQYSEVASTFREGTFHYQIPLDDGQYTVSLTFIEPSAKPGERRFNVMIGGRAVVHDLDIAAAAGAPLTALIRSFSVTVSDGALEMAFRPSVGQAIVSSIEVQKN